MLDIIVIGGSTRDLFFISPNYKVEDDRLEFVWGEKFVVEGLIREVGGGGCNAAVGLTRLGLKAALLSQVGDDPSGEQIAKRLKEENVNTHLLRIESLGITSTSVLLASTKGEHTIVMYRGGNDELLEKSINWNNLGETSWFYLSDISTSNGDPSLKLAQFAKEKEIKLAFIPGQHHLKLGVGHLRAVLSSTEILILNAYEACLLLGEDFSDISKDLVEKMLRRFFKLGVKLVVITRDIDGVQAYNGSEFFRVPAPKVSKPADTTGAGDAFSTGFVAAVIKGRDINEALEWGTKNADSVIKHFGAQPGLLHLDQLAS